METKQTRQGGLLKWLVPIAAVALLLVVLNLVNEWHFEMRLLDAPEATIQCKAPYDEHGAQSLLLGRLFMRKGFALPVRQDGKVDPDTIGDYTVTYETDFLGFQGQMTKVVHVVDTTGPVITLVPDEREYVLPGNGYDDPGFTAVDTVDGDLTAQVQTTIVDDGVLYSVTDAAGNTTEIKRDVYFHDPDVPELTLMGQTDYELAAGEVFEEPGYTAIDNVDGDITNRVVVTGEVNSFAVGTYELTYDVEDSAHNHATATRKVTVTKVQQPDVVNPTGKVIYLTFDDGPGQYTEKLLGILDKYNVKATFFVINFGYTDLIAKEAAAGHSVGIHSATHDYNKIYASEEAYFADLQEMNEIIKEQTGSYTTLLRFPGGSSNTVSNFNPGIMTRLTQRVTDAGFQYFDWNVSSGDAGETTDTDVVYQNVINGVQYQDASIVLQHDIKGFSVDAVERIILWGLEHGYTFLPLDPTSPTAHHGVNN